jgi:hypothetical protein
MNQLREAKLLRSIDFDATARQLAVLSPLILSDDMHDLLLNDIVNYLLSQVSLVWFDRLHDNIGGAPKYASFWLDNSAVSGQIHNDVATIKELIFPIADQHRHLTDQLIDTNKLKTIIANFWATSYSKYLSIH